MTFELALCALIDANTDVYFATISWLDILKILITIIKAVKINCYDSAHNDQNKLMCFNHQFRECEGFQTSIHYQKVAIVPYN